MSQVTGRAAAALALLGLIAVASTSRLDSGGRLASGPAGYLVLGVAGVVTLLVIVFWLTLGGFAARVEMRRSTRVVLLGAVAALALAVGAVLLSPTPLEHFPGPSTFGCYKPRSYFELRGWDKDAICGPGSSSAAGEGDGLGAGGGNATAALALAAGASVMVLAVIGVAIVTAVRRRHAKSSGAAVEDEAVLQALDESLDDLRREPDVRRAIVACYARMERALAGAGRERRPHETPLEFLRRVLERVANEPGQVLTELFERARFSVEPMGESEKRSAIGALQQLRAEVVG
jgi:hypothetical protein